MEIAVKQKNQTMKQQMYDILIDVSWAQLSMKYFGKSRSWLHQKMSGINSNGGEGDFSEKEKETLKYALNDLAKRIQTCAASI